MPKKVIKKISKARLHKKDAPSPYCWHKVKGWGKLQKEMGEKLSAYSFVCSDFIK